MEQEEKKIESYKDGEPENAEFKVEIKCTTTFLENEVEIVDEHDFICSSNDKVLRVNTDSKHPDKPENVIEEEREYDLEPMLDEFSLDEF